MKAVFLFVFLLGSMASAEVVFTENEIQEHQAKIGVVTSTAAKCLSETYADHVAFFKKWGVSKYYGNRKPEHRTQAGRAQALARYGAPAHLISQLEPISCIGLTVKCLGKGFEAAGQTETWNKIYAALAVGNNFYGTDLQKMLAQLGWVTLYWNPDPSQNAAWDKIDQALNPLPEGRTWNPVWGGHAARYASVMKSNNYFGISIKDKKTLVGFGSTPPAAFTRQSFFVGTAHAGYHVFPGYKGKVIEAHSMRNLNAFDNLEVSPFSPLDAKGGPRSTRSEKYRSGVIVIPPGSALPPTPVAPSNEGGLGSLIF